MATVEGALGARTTIGSDLKAGVDMLSYDQEVAFDLYVRVVLPLDGYVFWVRATDLGPSALLNAMPLNVVTPNQSGQPIPRPSFIVQGSLHYGTESTQAEERNIATNRVVFTSEFPIDDLNSLGPDLIYMADVDGPPAFGGAQPPASTTSIRFAFSTRGSYYRQANLWHYVGMAVYPTMASQVVDDPRLLSNELIVSNSLPIWLAFNQYNPTWPVPVPRPQVTIYPSFLVPDNLRPPYVTAHIQPEGTVAVQSSPHLNRLTDQSQLMQETVRFTCYGMSNAVAQSFLYSLQQYSEDMALFGLLNIPSIRDEKEGQNEMNTLAQKKTINMDVSYVTGTVRNVARQLVETVITDVATTEYP